MVLFWEGGDYFEIIPQKVEFFLKNGIRVEIKIQLCLILTKTKIIFENYQDQSFMQNTSNACEELFENVNLFQEINFIIEQLKLYFTDKFLGCAEK